MEPTIYYSIPAFMQDWLLGHGYPNPWPPMQAFINGWEAVLRAEGEEMQTSLRKIGTGAQTACNPPKTLYDVAKTNGKTFFMFCSP